MKAPEKLYEAAVERIAQAVALRRGEADYCAIENGDFVIDHDTALALAAAEAVGLRELYQALCEARAALAHAQAPSQHRVAA
ncbi:MAG: hypothetical protein ACK4MV_13945 [Beijerinckiaceae bacterium]